MSDVDDLGLVSNVSTPIARPASGEQGPTMSQWLGHHDLCSVQWSSVCSCDPDNPIDFSEQEVPDGR